MSRDDEGPKVAGQCDPCSPSVRNRYFRGKLLTVADYEAEQRYMIQRRRMLNRAMFGWGVVSGFNVWLDGRDLRIGQGVALDPDGREIVACEAVQLDSPEDVVWLDYKAQPTEPPSGESEGDERDRPTRQTRADDREQSKQDYDSEEPIYLLSVHYAERRVGGVRIDEGCGESVCETNHVCETAVYSLREVGECPSGLAGCRDPQWEYQDCPEDWEGRPAKLPTDRPYVAPINDRGTHEQLVNWSLNWLNGFDPCEPAKLCHHGCVELDTRAGVPLACVRIGFHCRKAYVVEILDSVRPRRLARPNDLLFDLVRGCDLVRIQDVGWRAWLDVPCKEVRFSDFAAMFLEPGSTPKNSGAGRRGRRARPPADTRLSVCFSGPVQVTSLTPDVITISLIQRDLNEDVGNVVRVPIPALAIAETTEGDPEGTTRSFRPLVSSRFWEGEINPDNSSGFETVTLVEIEVRTAFIVDPYGQEVAGGGRFVPGRAGSPGDRFLSSFTVVPDDYPTADQQSQAADQNAQEV